MKSGAQGAGRRRDSGDRLRWEAVEAEATRRPHAQSGALAGVPRPFSPHFKTIERGKAR